MKDFSKKCAFYGTLRKNQGNYHSFDLATKAKHINTAVINGFVMLNLGWYPMVFPQEDGSIVVDLFEITNPDTYAGIKQMELGAGYKEQVVKVDGIDYILYVANPSMQEWFKETVLAKTHLIPGGDWVNYNTSKKINAGASC